MSDKKNEEFLNVSLDQIMSDRFGRYSKYIIQGRALPDARDGLKPVQRRILFSMSELGLLHNRPFKKSARVVGEVIGKYHPHGDSSIYEAMVRMSQNWKMNMQLIEMHGNNGSIDDDPAAAMRYTEARLSNLSEQMINGIKKETVPFAPNFDDSEKEPTVLPGFVPNLLVNGARGIAAGYATEMPPHNLSEVIDAIITKIKSPNARLETLMQCIKGPDFPTGGIVQGYDGIFSAFERGRGKIVIRSKYEINNSKTKPSITITELPYGVVKSKMVRQIADIQFNKKISGIKNVRDESDRNGISVFIELAPGTDVDAISKYLLSKTDMQVYYSYNNIAIKDNAPKQMGLGELIDAYLEHQKDVQRKSISFDLRRDETRHEIVIGLIKVSEMADQVIKTIRNASGSKSGVVVALMSGYNFTELQAKAIADLRLYRLSKTDQSIYLEEKATLSKRIEWAQSLLENEQEFNNHLITRLRELKKNFGAPRKTEIEREVESLNISREELIKHEDAWIGVSRQGYIKRFSNRAYESNELSSYALKEEDIIVYLHKINTSDKLLIFTNKGRYVFVPTHEVKEVKFKDVGKHINDFAAIAPDEKVIDVISVNDFSLKSFITLVTKQGKAKRVAIKSFEAKRYSTPFIAFKLSPGDELIGARASNGNRQVVIISKMGKSVKYSEVQLSIQGTKSSGIKAISLVKDDLVSAFAIGSNNDILGIISKRGGGKRIRFSSILPMSRTTQGKQIFRFVKGNPHIPLDARTVETTTTTVFKYDGADLAINTFNKVDITSTEEGFSNFGPSQIFDGQIMKYNRIHKDSSLFNVEKNVSEEEKFNSAEQKIEKASQISIDDILKDL